MVTVTVSTAAYRELNVWKSKLIDDSNKNFSYSDIIMTLSEIARPHYASTSRYPASRSRQRAGKGVR